MGSPSPLTAVHAAIVQRVRASDKFTMLAGRRIQNTTRPAQFPFPLLTYFEPRDDAAPRFGAGGADVATTFHAWSPFADSEQVTEIWSAFREEFNGVNLALAGGHVMYWSRARLARAYADGDDPNVTHGVIEYRALTLYRP